METPVNDCKHDGTGSHTTSTTINHIYLLADSGQSQFNSWMEKIGPLVQMASGHISLKPVIDLLIRAISPERIFVINHNGMPSYQINGYTEILVIIDECGDVGHEQHAHFVKLALSQNPDIFISLGDAAEIESLLEFGSPYHCAHFRNRFQVYSKKPKRIIELDPDQMAKLKSETAERFRILFYRAQILYNNAAGFLKEENTDLSALLLYQTLLLVYQSIITAFKGPLPEMYSAMEYQKTAKRYLPVITNTDRLKYLPEKLEETCILQGQHNFKNTKAAIELLYRDVQYLINICEVAMTLKISQFDNEPSTVAT